MDGALDREAIAVKHLKENFAEILGDDDLLHDTIEGQTGFLECLDKVVSQINEEQIIQHGANELSGIYKDRADAAAKRIKDLKALIETAILTAELPSKTFRTPLATLTMKKSPDSLGEIDEADIPSQYFERQQPKLDKRKLLQALKNLKEEESIPGATLKPGAQTIQIRRK